MNNEATLIIQLQQGDEYAFKLLVDQWQDMIYNTALGIVQNENDADDITQEVFIQVYQSVSSFKGEAKFSTWLYRITVTKSLDYLKKKRTKKRFGFVQTIFGKNDEDMHPKEFKHPGILFENKESAIELFKALQKLPDKQRVAFTLHKLEAQKHQDIAEIMKLSVIAVESLIARAKKNLKQILQDYYLQNILDYE